MVPALSMGFDLVVRQPSRLPEFTKFIIERFTYNLDDLQQGYTRQHILLDTLSAENRSVLHVNITHGIT